MLKRHEIQVPRRAGHTLEEVVKLAGVSQSSVQRVEAEAPVSSVDDAIERAQRRIGRPSKVQAFGALLAAEIAKQPGVLAVELLRRARLEGYAGGKSALYELIRTLRPHEVFRARWCALRACRGSSRNMTSAKSMFGSGVALPRHGRPHRHGGA